MPFVLIIKCLWQCFVFAILHAMPCVHNNRPMAMLLLLFRIVCVKPSTRHSKLPFLLFFLRLK